ncbi:hypothetical protein N6H14_08175 [Paenibacillus sp. CC-CFT747]|nr:hypothetical protein N6H14_08175 [Paenibacillus sp. CC-CFT747]
MAAVKAYPAGIPSWGVDGTALQGGFLAAGLVLAAAALGKAKRLQPAPAPGGAR